MFEGTFFFRQHTGESCLGVYSALFRFLIDVFRAIYISSDLLTIRDLFAYLFCVCLLICFVCVSYISQHFSFLVFLVDF